MPRSSSICDTPAPTSGSVMRAAIRTPCPLVHASPMAWPSAENWIARLWSCVAYARRSDKACMICALVLPDASTAVRPCVEAPQVALWLS